MSDIVLSVENLYKRYRLGSIDSQAFKEDVVEMWASFRGKPSPYDTYITSNELAAVSDASQVKSRYVWALQDVNFDVKQGEIVGIIGKNGSGKSTLLKILSKTTSPTRGQVKIKGRIASLLEVGTGFHPELTGKQNIYLNGAILGMKKHEITRRLDEIIAFAGIEAFIDTPVKRYSSGMYVRLAFAVAAHLESDILILDEVLAVGDAEFQKKCLGKMKDVSQGDGKTVLFVSHNMQSIESLCTTGVFLNNGCMKNKNKIDEIIKNYSDHLFNITELSKLDVKNRRSRTSGVCVIDNVKWDINKSFVTNENIELTISVLFNEDVDGLGIYLAFRNPMSGEIITTIKRGITNNKITKNQKLDIDFNIINKFRPGSYSLYIVIGDYPCRFFYDVIDENASLPLLKIHKQYDDPHLNIGIFELDATFSLNYDTDIKS